MKNKHNFDKMKNPSMTLRNNFHENKPGEHCDCGEEHHHDCDTHIHDANCGCPAHKHAETDLVQNNLFADSNEKPGIFSDEFEVDIKDRVKWEVFAHSLVRWIEEVKSWIKDNKALVGHIKIFAAAANNKTLWLATTGKSLNAKYSPEINICGNDSINKCKISMTFIVFRINGDMLKKEVLDKLESNIARYKI